MSEWNTSLVTNMEGAFRDMVTFNADISGWDTSGVTNMAHMFYNARQFSQNITSWEGSAASSLQRNIFYGAKSLRPNLFVLLFSQRAKFVHNARAGAARNVQNCREFVFGGRTAEGRLHDVRYRDDYIRRHVRMGRELSHGYAKRFFIKDYFQRRYFELGRPFRERYEPHVLQCELVYSRLE